MKKIGFKVLVSALLLALLLSLTACGPAKLLLGKWKDNTGNIEYEFGKDGVVIATMYGFPLTVSYTLEGDTLSIVYSEELIDSGTITFYGDNEFVWDKTDENGEAYQEYYARNTD